MTESNKSQCLCLQIKVSLKSIHLTHICLLLLACDVIPKAIWSNPGAVLVVISVVWLVIPPVGKGDRCIVNPAESSFIKKVCKPYPGTSAPCKSINRILFSLRLNSCKSGSFSYASRDCSQIV